MSLSDYLYAFFSPGFRLFVSGFCSHSRFRPRCLSASFHVPSGEKSTSQSLLMLAHKCWLITTKRSKMPTQAHFKKCVQIHESYAFALRGRQTKTMRVVLSNRGLVEAKFSRHDLFEGCWRLKIEADWLIGPQVCQCFSLWHASPIDWDVRIIPVHMDFCKRKHKEVKNNRPKHSDHRGWHALVWSAAWVVGQWRDCMIA